MPFSPRQLEAISYFRERYDLLFDLPLVADRPIKLTDDVRSPLRRCRFCGRPQTEVSFKAVAHAAPEFLGNQSLISMNECDVCNKYLADECEDHLAKWFGPMRTISQIAGKKGVPTYKDKHEGGRIRIEMGDEGLRFTVVNADIFKQLSCGGPLAFTLPVETPSQPYVPLRAAMALVKIACSVCPASELPQCAPAIEWLMGRMRADISKFPVLYAFTPGPNPYETGKVMLLRRKVDEAIPYFWCIVATANYRFQFFVPFVPRDIWLKCGVQSTFQAMQFPVPFGADWEFGQTEYGMFDWAGTERVVKQPRVTLNVERAELIRQSGDESPP